MPPRETSPNQEPNFRSPSEAVEWYRSLGQDANLFGLSDELVQAAVLIEQRGQNLFLRNKEGVANESQPAILDAVCLYAEAARATSNVDQAQQYRKRAQHLAKRIAESRDSSTSLKVDAIMLMIDAEFANLYDLYFDQRISEQEFTQSWQLCHEYSLTRFNEELQALDDKDDFSAGRFGEWFFLNTHRHIQLEDETYDNSSIRTTFTREDCAVKRPRRENFDIARDTKANDTWRTSKKYQVKVVLNDQLANFDYGRDIEVRILRFVRGESFDKIIREDTDAMLTESRSLLDDQITLTGLKRNALADAKTRVGV